MGQHRAALRAKARRAKADYWRKMRPFVVFFAGWLAAINRARVKRAGEALGGYIRDRLNERSFAEMILPRVDVDLEALDRILRPPSMNLADDEVVEYEIDENDVVTLWITKDYGHGDSRLHAMMDKETFEALRNEPNGNEGP